MTRPPDFEASSDSGQWVVLCHATGTIFCIGSKVFCERKARQLNLDAPRHAVAKAVLRSLPHA